MVVRFNVKGSDRPYFLTRFCDQTGMVEFSSFLDDAIQFTRLDVASKALVNASRFLESDTTAELWEPAKK